MDFIPLLVFGVLFIWIGFMNIKGNINTIHWYHRARIKKEDIKKYGLLVGIGTLLIGISMILTVLIQIIFDIEFFEYLIIIGLVIWFVLFIYAQIKYNKGIF